MNDRFKFRVWDNIRKAYCPETIYIDQQGKMCRPALDDDKEYVIEQSTGLRDKNGKLIYEGDIVLFVGKVNLAVQYTPNEWEMAGDDVNVPLTENTARFVKIVGNIHEVNNEQA